MQGTRTLASGRNPAHHYVSALAGPSSGPATAVRPCCNDSVRSFASSPTHGRIPTKSRLKKAPSKAFPIKKPSPTKALPKKEEPEQRREVARPPVVTAQQLRADRYEEQQLQTLQLQRARVGVLRHLAESFTAVANDAPPVEPSLALLLASGADADAEATYGPSGREEALLDAEAAAREAQAAKAPLVFSSDWLARKAELLAEAAQRRESSSAVSSGNVSTFRKGTLVYVEGTTYSGVAVVLDTVLLKRLELRLLKISGEIIYEAPSAITHAFAAHRLPEALAANAGSHDSIRLCSTQNHAARRAAIRLIRQVTRAEGEVRGAVETHMLDAWNHFRSKVDNERALVGSEDVARWVLEQDAAQLNELEALALARKKQPELKKELYRTVDDWARREEILRFAVQKHLVARSDRYICESGRDPWNATRWRVRSYQEVTEMAAVRTMIEKQSSDIMNFVEKARSLIDHSRPSLDAPPPEETGDATLPQLCPADPSLPTFTGTDLVILRHIQASFFVSERQFSPFSQTVPWILKRIERYGEVFDAECTARFLVEVGVRSPWDNWAALGSTLEFVKGERRAEERVPGKSSGEISTPTMPASAASSSSTSTPVLGPDDLYPSDQLDHLRHDFGQLNVFVIDDPDAAELDDGVSVERCDDQSRVWVHTHIADPTTLLHPGHRLAASALAKASTAYLPEGNYPLLPDALTLDRFSLGGKGGVVDPIRGQEALSFSALLDLTTGEMLDYKVRAGIIRNVHVTSYQAVNSALGCQPAEAQWPIGRPPARFEATKPRPFKPEWMADIKLLQQVARAIHRRRFQAGAISWSSADYQVKVSPSPLPTLPLQPQPTPVFSAGAPFVSYRVTPADGSRSESQQLVASCMTLAGNVAGRFFRDRGLPTAYRFSPAAVSKTREGLEQLLASRDPETGHVNPLDMDRLGVVLQAGKVSLTPETHWAMGITAEEGGYVRVTSPLRRYGDIIAHWQIKQALLAEAPSASSDSIVSARTPRSAELFSAAEVLDWNTSVELTSRLVKQASDRSRAFWGIFALERHARKRSTLDSHMGNVHPPVHAYPFARAPVLPTARLGPFTDAIIVRSNVVPLSPLSRTVVVAIPDLGLQLEAHYPKGKTYTVAERVSVLIDEFYLGAESKMVGTIVA